MESCLILLTVATTSSSKERAARGSRREASPVRNARGDAPLNTSTALLLDLLIFWQ